MTTNNIRRRRRVGGNTLDGLVASGKASLLTPVTESGWYQYSSAGREFMPAATNLVPDPQGVLANGTFWPGDGTHNNTTANVDVPVAIPSALAGLTKCLSIVNDGTAEDSVTANLTVSASSPYTTSIYVYAPTVGGNVAITAENGHSFALGTVAVANATWTRYSIYSPTVAGEVTLNIKLAFAGGGASTIYVTGAMVERTPVLTPFFCGAATAGGPGSVTWTGAANASTSTRVISTLRYTLPPAFPQTLGATTLIARWLAPFAGSVNLESLGPPYFPALAALHDGTTDAVLGYRRGLRYRTQTGADSASTDDLSFLLGSSHSFVFRTDAAKSHVMVDGANTESSGAPTLGAATTIAEIGNAATAANGLQLGSYGYIGNVAFVPRKLTDADAVSASTLISSGSGYDLYRFLIGAGYTGSIVVPLEGHGNAYMGWSV